jgi:hypothetical protein
MLAVYTLVVDRLEYTIETVYALENDNNVDFIHFILSQGSERITNDWLKGYPFKHETHTYFWDENRGISIGSNFLVEEIAKAQEGREYPIRVISKVDNDIETITPNWLDRCYAVASNHMILCSPLVMGLKMFPDGVPGYAGQTMGGEFIRMTHHIGGIVHMARAALHIAHTYPTSMTYAMDQDTTLSRAATNQFYLIGYLEDVKIRHRDTTEGQMEKYPEYFKKKLEVWEKEVPSG